MSPCRFTLKIHLKLFYFRFLEKSYSSLILLVYSLYILLFSLKPENFISSTFINIPIILIVTKTYIAFLWTLLVEILCFSKIFWTTLYYNEIVPLIVAVFHTMRNCYSYKTCDLNAYTIFHSFDKQITATIFARQWFDEKVIEIHFSVYSFLWALHCAFITFRRSIKNNNYCLKTLLYTKI